MYSRIDEKNDEVCDESNVYADLECFVWRQSKVEEQESTLYNPVYEIIVDFLDEQRLNDLQLLCLAQRSHTSGFC
jgi:hypothetical protein